MENEPTDLVVPLIDRERCTGCGLCRQLCPTKALEVQRGKAVIVRAAACNFCEVCESHCPTGAIGRPFRIAFAADYSPTGESR